MRFATRWAVVTVLSATVLVACSDKHGLSGTRPDSGTPDLANTTPDGAEPLDGGDDLGSDATVRPPESASITASPPAVDFGTFDMGAASAPVLVTVSNTGSAASGPLTVLVRGTGIASVGCSGVSLAPQATCTLSITAQVSVSGPISGTIDVGESSAGLKRISVTGLAVTPGGQLTVSPSPLDLGPVLPGKTATGTIVLTNPGFFDVSGVGIAVNGPGYSLSPTGTCTGTLAAQQSCNIVVSFTGGSTLGPAKGTVTVRQGGVTKTVPVTATVGQAAGVLLSPSSASLPTMVGTPSAPASFTVQYGGDESGPAPAVTITGVNKDDFGFTTTCNQPRVPGETNTCQIEVVYTPKVATVTNATATLTVTLPSGASASAALVGTAVTGGPPSILGDRTDFGSVVVGSTSAALTFTMPNNGSEALKITNVSTSLPQFTIATDNCTGKETPPKASCTFTVQFKPVPGDLGAMNGNLKVAFENSPFPSYLTVTGTAIPATAVPPPWDQARLGNGGTGWWMNAQKGKFFLSIKLRNSYPEDTAGRAEAVSISKLVASRTGSTAVDLVPLPKELPGIWAYDPDQQGPVVATTYDQVTSIIDGAAAPFYTSAYSAKVLAWANYSESRGDMSYRLDLQVWEMASAGDAAALYTDLLKNSLYSSVSWKTCQSSGENLCP